MKKKFILLLIVLMGLCMSLFAGCSILREILGGAEGNPSESDQVLNIEAPEWIRLDMADGKIYFASCAESGVTYYEIRQDWGTGDERLNVLDTTVNNYPPYIEEEDCYVLRVNVIHRAPFDIVVICKAKATDSYSVRATFTFYEGEGIIYDAEHCTFDSESGLFTWTAVEGASGYMLSGRSEPVTQPQCIIDPRQDKITVTPLYDTNKIGVPVTAEFGGFTTHIDYIFSTETLTWNECGKSYLLELTEDGETKSYELTENSFKYLPPIPVEHVDIKLTSYNELRRPGVSTNSLDFLPRIPEIDLSKLDRWISWKPVDGIKEYALEVIKSDGSIAASETINTYSYKLPHLGLGTAKVRVKPIDESRPKFYSVYTEFDIQVLPNPKDPVLEVDYDKERGIAKLSFETDPVGMQSYTVSLYGTENSVVEVDADENPVVNLQMNLAPNTLGRFRVESTLKEREGLYCYLSYSHFGVDKKVIYLTAPEVEMVNKNATLRSSRAFTVRLKYPDVAPTEGKLSANLNYYYTSFKSDEISADKEYTLELASETKELSASYSYTTIGDLATFSDKFTVDITRVRDFSLTVDDEKISWLKADNAVGYKVEELVGNEYIERQSSPSTEYMHGITTPQAARKFRVTALSEGTFAFDGYSEDHSILKLYTPEVYVSNRSYVSVSVQSGARAVLYMGGNELTKIDEEVKAALVVNSTVTVTAHCERANTETATYLNSDDEVFTFRRIVDMDVAELNLKVNAKLNKVSWDKPAGAFECSTLLYYRASEEEEYELYHDYSGDGTEIDVSGLSHGYYELEVKPASWDDGNNIYLYLGGYASDTFFKEGIFSACALQDNTGFSIDSDINTSGGYDVGWQVSFTTYTSASYDFDMGETITIAQNDRFMDRLIGEVPTGYNGGLTFRVNYGDGADTFLSQNKTLKADPYNMDFIVKRRTGVGFSGTYEYLDEEPVRSTSRIKVTLTPQASLTLHPLESYTIIYGTSAYPNSEVSKVSETEGTELSVNITGRVVRKFRLGIRSDYLTEEDGVATFIRSGEADYSSDRQWYELMLQEVPDISFTVGRIETNSYNVRSVEITINFLNFRSSDRCNLKYFQDDGSEYTVKRWNTEDIDPNSSYTIILNESDLQLFEGKVIRFVARRAKYVNTEHYERYEASQWMEFYVTIPNS